MKVPSWFSTAFCFLLLAGFSTVALAQDEGPLPPPKDKPLIRRSQPSEPEAKIVTVPAGTKIPLALRHAITTKTARVGDAVYAETTFPIVANDQIVIPPGSYMQGSIGRVERPGRLKGRAEILVHFHTLIFPSGYTLQLAGAIDNANGDENSQVKDKEGTIQREGSKGKDAQTIASAGTTGALIGAVSNGGKGTLIGGGLGSAAGLAGVLLSRGPDLRFEAGATLETSLQRPLDVDINRTGSQREFYARPLLRPVR